MERRLEALHASRTSDPTRAAAPVPRTRIGVQEEGTKLGVVDEAVSLRDLVDGLNELGVGPRDLISILQAIKASGAIQAEIEVM
jgi:flagellar P-ring protein FlgI